MHLALALGVLAEGDLAVDLGDDRVVLRLAGLEQLGDAGQTAGDVLHFVVSRGIFAMMSPASMSRRRAPRCGADGEEVARLELELGSLSVCPSWVLDADARAEVGRASTR
jgi:hypothetical protein